MRLLFILILILLSFCTIPKNQCDNSRIITGHISDDFSSDEKKAIRDGIDEWNYVLNGQYGKEITFLKARNQDKVARNEHTIIAYAFADRIGGNIIYFVPDRQIWQDNKYRDWNILDFKSITLHEMGHALGLEHSTNLMVPGYTGSNYDCVDDETIIKFAQKNNLNAVNLRPDPYCK